MSSSSYMLYTVDVRFSVVHGLRAYRALAMRLIHHHRCAHYLIHKCTYNAHHLAAVCLNSHFNWLDVSGFYMCKTRCILYVHKADKISTHTHTLKQANVRKRKGKRKEKEKQQSQPHTVQYVYMDELSVCAIAAAYK